jgi:hypothetical protein
MQGVQTIQDPLAYCAALAPYPFFKGETQKNSRRVKEDRSRSFEGETQKNSRRVKEDVVHSKGREFSSDLKIDTIDNPTLARILVSYQKPMEIQEDELVEQI